MHIPTRKRPAKSRAFLIVFFYTEKYDIKKRYVGYVDMKIENKEMLLYCAEKSVNAVRKAETGHTDKKEVYFVIGTAIHWIVDCIDRIPKDQVKEEHKKIFSATRYANNCLKHNATFREAHEVKGLNYPYDYPYDYGTYFVWDSLDEVYIQENKENQRKNYKEKLEGNRVFSTLLEILEDVRKYYVFL